MFLRHVADRLHGWRWCPRVQGSSQIDRHQNICHRDPRLPGTWKICDQRTALGWWIQKHIIYKAYNEGDGDDSDSSSDDGSGSSGGGDGDDDDNDDEEENDDDFLSNSKSYFLVKYVYFDFNPALKFLQC